MKKLIPKTRPILFGLTLLLSFSPLLAQSPIEITYEDYNLDMDGLSLIVGDGTSDISTNPQEGENVIWDFGGISGETIANIHPWVEVEECFSGEVRMANQGFVGTGNQANWLFSFEEGGIRTLGMRQPGAFLFLGGGGGLLWKDTCLAFPEEQYWLPFPLSYQDAWQRDVTEVRPYAIEVPGVLESSEGEIVRRSVVTDSVTAWGTIIIPGPNGPTAFEVLMVEQVVFQIDSVFLEGEPAFEGLLNLFEIEQGQTTTRRVYTWRSNQNEVLFVLGTTLFGDHLYHAYLADPMLPTSTEELEETLELSIFPNPVKGQIISIESKAFLEDEMQVRLWNSLGQLEHTQTLNFEPRQQIQLKFPLSSGVYWLEITNSDLSKRTVQSIVVE